jgi:hypothetical protein
MRNHRGLVEERFRRQHQNPTGEAGGMRDKLRLWLRRWLNIENLAKLQAQYCVEVLDLEERLGKAEAHCRAADEAFQTCCAEIEKLREERQQKAEQPQATVRRASTSEFRQAVEAPIYEKLAKRR